MEWRFQVAPPGETVRPLTPDIAFLAYDRMLGKENADWDSPLGAPSVAIEIRPARDRKANLADKVATLLRAGTDAVIVIDPENRTAEVHDPSGMQVLGAPGTLEHTALPGFAVDLTEMFDALELDKKR